MPKISNSYESERKRILARTALKLERMVNTLLEKHLEEQGVTENNTEEEIRTKCTPEVLQPFLEDVAEITGCMNSTIWIYEDGKLWIKAATGLAKGLLDRDNVFYEINEEAVTPEIWRTGEIKCAYNKEQLSKYQGERGRGKFDDIWKGPAFEVFYGFLLKAFGKIIGVIKIENPPGQGRLFLEKEKEELIKKAHEFNLSITKEQIDKLKQVNFNIDIPFLEEYNLRIPEYEEFMNYLVYLIKSFLRDIKGVEAIEARIKSFESVIEKICRKDKLDAGETKYKKGYFFHSFIDLAGIRVITNNLASLRKIEDKLFRLIDDEETIVGIARITYPQNRRNDDPAFIKEPGAIIAHESRDMIERNPNLYEYAHWIGNSKEDGYRGVHFVLGKNVGLGEGQKHRHINILCEVQLRTIRQHSWATEHHELLYKRNIPEGTIRKEMRELSDKLNEVDSISEELRPKIDKIMKEGHDEKKV